MSRFCIGITIFWLLKVDFRSRTNLRRNGPFCGLTRCQTAILTPSLDSASSRRDKNCFLPATRMEKRSRTGWGGGGDLDVTNSTNPQSPRLGRFGGEFLNNPAALQWTIACQSLLAAAGQNPTGWNQIFSFFRGINFWAAGMVSHTETKRHLKGTHLVRKQDCSKMYIFLPHTT